MKWTGLVAVFAILVSCSSQGNLVATSQGIEKSFVVGKTSKKQVHAELGQPHDVRVTSKSSRWSYYHTKTQMNGLGFIPVFGLVLPDTNVQTAVRHVQFDAKEKYKSSTLETDSSKMNSLVGVGNGIVSFTADKQSGRVKAEMAKLKLPYDKTEAIKAKDMGTVLGANPEL